MKSITFVSVAAILSSTSAFSPSHIQLHERKIMNSISPSSNGASSLVATPTNTNPLHYNTQDKTSPLLFKVNEEDDTIAIENNKEMNQVLVEKEQLVKKSRVVRSTPIKNVVTLETMDDFKQHIESNEDKVVVVRFFASWCRMCKGTEPSFNRFARRNPHISFVNIPFTKNNAQLHESLNVKSVPYGHIYQRAELVDEMNLSTKNWSVFEKSVNSILVHQ